VVSAMTDPSTTTRPVRMGRKMNHATPCPAHNPTVKNREGVIVRIRTKSPANLEQ
jgi:hypothetical protein